MPIDRYSALKAVIADWLDNDALVASIPALIALAEARMSRRLRVWRMHKTVDIKLSGDAVRLPDDFVGLNCIDILDRPGLPLTYLPPAVLGVWGTSKAPGLPQRFSIQGDKMHLAPAAKREFPARMLYCAAIPPLSDDTPSNWLLRCAPDAYLYGALTSAAAHVPDDPRLEIWAQLFERALAGIEAEDRAARITAHGTNMDSHQCAVDWRGAS